jgi:rhodanese-related sulfurtransferase
MNAKRLVLATLLIVTVLVAACAPAATPAPTATPVPAFDMKATLDKYFSNLPDGFGTIAPAALKDQMAATKVFVVDIREAKEVADNGYIEGSVNIPVRTFIKNLDKLPAKDQPIVVTCGSGHRSALGMVALQMLGYTNVKSLAGGFGAWKKAELPAATGKPADPVAGKSPDVDKDLQAALDKYFSNLPDGFGTIAPAALNDQLAAAKPFQFDAREAKEITDNGMIAGSVNIPIRTLIKSLDKLPQDKSAAIIAECGSGHRSAMAMMALNLLGYTNVKSLAGGFGAWKAANLPISK